MGESHRIAVATSDCLTVYQHFGQTRGFQIVDIVLPATGAAEDSGEEASVSYEFAEYRSVPAPCDGGTHQESAFDAVLALLPDCEAVVVGKIGPGAAEYLVAKGMRVFEAPGVLENILATLVRRGLL